MTCFIDEEKKNEALLCYGLQKRSSQTTCLGDFHRTVLTSWGSNLFVGDYKSRAAAARAVFVHHSGCVWNAHVFSVPPFPYGYREFQLC